MYSSINVLSRQEMIDYTKTAIKPYVIVSISDVNENSPIFATNKNEIDILYLNFEDGDHEPKCISRKQANDIVNFVKDYEDLNIDLFFHCKAGISRSAGCAAAIMLYEYGNNSIIFDNSKYRPNMKCYRRILDALDITYSDIIRAKERKIDLYK